MVNEQMSKLKQINIAKNGGTFSLQPCSLKELLKVPKPKKRRYLEDESLILEKSFEVSLGEVPPVIHSQLNKNSMILT